MVHRRLRFFLSVTFLLVLVPVCRAEEMTHSTGQNMAEMKFVQFPGMPPCSTGSVQNGDPTTGPSIILAKATTGCTIPWHWHTPNEHLMMITGVARAEMKDGASITLRPGGFALMPSHHVHRFTCTKSCTFFVHSDAAFDMHYVNGDGGEISPDEALKAAPARK